MPPQPPRRLGAKPLTELRKDGVEKGFAWVNNAREDLISANNNYNSGDYAWSAFISFTSAEKGLKAVIFMFEENPEGMLRHPLRDYYERALAHVPELAYISEAVDVFEEYDSFIRYPLDSDRHSAPSDRYDQKDAAEASEAASAIISAATDVVDAVFEIINEAYSEI